MSWVMSIAGKVSAAGFSPISCTANAPHNGRLQDKLLRPHGHVPISGANHSKCVGICDIDVSDPPTTSPMWPSVRPTAYLRAAAVVRGMVASIDNAGFVSYLFKTS